MPVKKTQAAKKEGKQEVDAFLEKLDHPLKAEIEVLRSIILKAGKPLTEQIKWNAPSFCYLGEDRLTFKLYPPKNLQLVFHCGAKVRAQKPAAPLIEDSTGLLQWAAPDRAVAQFTDMKDICEKKASLVAIVNRWMEAAAGYNHDSSASSTSQA